MRPLRISLLGCPLDAVSVQEIVQQSRAAFAENKTLIIEGLNVAKLVAARRDPLLMEALHRADYVHADGAGIMLAARLLGITLPPRRAGIDLMQDLIALCIETQKSLFLLGATEAIVTQTAQKLQHQFPPLSIAGTHHGYFDPQDATSIAKHVAASGAKLLLVGMSSPKKERFLRDHGQACRAAVAMGVGGAFDVVAGVVKRAPCWMQRNGLEWLFRMGQEPRRLGWRYLSANSTFAVLLAGALLKRYIFRYPLPHNAATIWADFLNNLRHHYGESALAYRHEIYFLHQKKWGGGRFHALLALMRDAWLLATSSAMLQFPPDTTSIAVVTLMGPSGYETIQRARTNLASHRIPVIAHPRIALSQDITYRPMRPKPTSFFQALYVGWQQGRRPRSSLSRIIVACCAARHALWKAS